MGNATEFTGTVFEDGSVTTMARIVGGDGDPIVRADITAIKYTVYAMSNDSGVSYGSVPTIGASGRTLTPVSNHNDVSLTPADVLFDTLQDDALWTVDAVGYNFRHIVDVSTHPAFATPGTYRIDYHLTPASGQIIIVRFRMTAI